jgi:glycosyltransferase involved in cell wall biosynthesis
MSATPASTGSVYFDISYTRTQTGHMGITRTVRRMLQEWELSLPSEGRKCIPVAFHSAGFRRVQSLAAASAAAPFAPASQSPAARLFRWVTSEFFRRAVIASTVLVPWRLLRFAWSATSSWTFDALSRGAPAVEFQRGDILFLCDASWNYPVWKASRLARRQGAKVVLLVYDLIPLRHPQFCFPLVPHIFGLWLRQMVGCSDAIVCISRATEEDLRRYARDTNAPLPPTGHFRLGSDPARSMPELTAVRTQLELFLGRGLPCFASIGSFEPKKNYGFLLEVFERLWADKRDVRLLIVGRETAECQNLIEKFRDHPEQGHRLLTLFDATDTEVAYTYEKCRALVFPSAAEGFGLPLVEARTRGSVVLASSLPAFVELADAGVFIYPEGSHSGLQALVIEHSLRDFRQETPVMSAFRWRDSARQCLELFESLLGLRFRG